MTRRRFYAAPEAFSSDATSAILNDDETKHLRQVLRLKIGAEVYVFDGEGREFRAQIQQIARNSTQLIIIEEAEPASPESCLHLTLAVALLKGEKFDLVLQKLTELGVTHVVPLITSRAGVRIRSDADALRKLDRSRRIALEATKQCGRARLMTIEKPTSFAEMIARADKTGGLRLMFAERAGESLAAASEQVTSVPDHVSALTGPEGGWTDDEIDQARAARWRIVTLGSRIMRAETAAIACSALLQHRFGDLK
ncbi:MAG TPA: 16S rRNA (uracil(1498)-N(3))-methyltransferase [Pyrinomonadaceae bacterium]|jgi:16S rRNA (uracil1498-N3)-methyltransferase|nr:16S rRNA (uracil(1498)-N(3))-methyltransferase [Pyrinomonadaceae bacterium]